MTHAHIRLPSNLHPRNGGKLIVRERLDAEPVQSTTRIHPNYAVSTGSMAHIPEFLSGSNPLVAAVSRCPRKRIIALHIANVSTNGVIKYIDAVNPNIMKA